MTNNFLLGKILLHHLVDLTVDNEIIILPLNIFRAIRKGRLHLPRVNG